MEDQSDSLQLHSPQPLPDIERKQLPNAGEGIKSYYQTQIPLPQPKKQLQEHQGYYHFNSPTWLNTLVGTGDVFHRSPISGKTWVKTSSISALG